MAPAAKENRAILVLSTVGWLSRLPSLASVAGSVAPAVCHLVLGAVRAPSGAMHGDARNDSKLATTRDGPRVVGTAAPSPRCGERARLPAFRTVRFTRSITAVFNL